MHRIWRTLNTRVEHLRYWWVLCLVTCVVLVWQFIATLLSAFSTSPEVSQLRRWDMWITLVILALVIPPCLWETWNTFRRRGRCGGREKQESRVPVGHSA